VGDPVNEYDYYPLMDQLNAFFQREHFFEALQYGRKFFEKEAQNGISEYLNDCFDGNEYQRRKDWIMDPDFDVSLLITAYIDGFVHIKYIYYYLKHSFMS